MIHLPVSDDVRSFRRFLRRVLRHPVTSSATLAAVMMVLALGCRGGDRATGPDAEATNLRMGPSSVALAPGDTVQMEATPVDENGNPVSGYEVSWTSGDSTVATVDGDGTVTGLSAGSTTVTAAASKKGQASSSISASVQASQGTDGKKKGLKKQSEVTVTDSTSATGNLEVITSTTGDSLDSDGYTVTVDGGSGQAIGINDTTVYADLTAEDHTVELTGVASNCSTSGSNPRSVSVAEDSTSSTSFDITCEATGTQSTSAEFRGNEPSGMTTIVNHRFGDLDNGGKWNVYRDSGFSLLRDTTAPYSPDSIVRTTYEAGPLDGHSPSGMDYQPGKYQEYYVSFWARWSDNWQGHKSGVNKILFLNYANFSSGVVIENHAIDDGPMRWQVVVQAGGLPSQKFRPNMTTTYFKRGEWVLWEVYVVMNTEGNSDGEMHAWINGIKQFEATSIQFVSSDNEERFSEINYEPIWGGRTDTVIERMHHDMDHLYISAK